MLEDLAARLRPRSAWEGLDLGLALSRQSFGRLLWHWCVILVPLWLALAVLLRNHPGWFLFVVWWFKPLYDRIPLLSFGRGLFGQETSLREVLRQLPSLFFKGNLFFLTTGRFSFWRSFSMPVKVLEQSSWQVYRRRVHALSVHGNGQALLLSMVMLLISCAFMPAGISLINQFAPHLFSEESEVLQHFWNDDVGVDNANLVWWVAAVFYLIGLSLMEIFYVGGGFGLYLNSRIHLEGWDVEITFRTMMERLGKASAVAIGCVLLLFTALAGPAEANADPSGRRIVLAEDVEAFSDASPGPLSGPPPKDALKEVLKHPDFEVHKEFYEEHVAPSRTSSPSSPPSTAPPSRGSTTGSLPPLSLEFLSTYGFWTVIFLLALLLGYVLYKNRHWFSGSKTVREKPKTATAVETVMGLEVAPEKLPPNIQQAARDAWQRGDYHTALRMLYAGSVCWMIDKAGLPVRESDTEGDCLRHMDARPESKPYFNSLTNTWIKVAYAKSPPTAQEVEPLLDKWPFGNIQAGGG